MPLSPRDLMLLPAPRQVRLLGDWARAAPDAAPAELLLAGDIDPASLQGQAYEVRILRAATGEADLELRAASPAGLHHARATLGQLRRRFGPRLPTLIIEDQPSFATRGVMLDVSRDRVPTMDHLFRTIDLLSSLKFNHLQLYTEHTFAYAGHEEVWAECSPITPAEVRTLDAHCRARGIALAANQNCFGHLAWWLKRPRYRGLAETHGDWMFDVWPRSGPFSLCPVDPASLAFVEDLLSQLLPCFSSALVNIGCDETYDVGTGRSAEAVAARGRAAVYAEFVAKVCGITRRQGSRPMFWADIALSNPEALAALPRELIALAWGYEPDAPFGEWCQAIKAASRDREAWVCPGTSSWRSIFGRTTERHGNLVAAATQGLGAGATGFLACDWGDTGHHQQWPIAAHALAHAAQAGWRADRAGDFDAGAAAMHALGIGAQPAPQGGMSDRAQDQAAARDLACGLGSWLEALGDADLALRETCLGLARPGVSGRLRNQSALFIDLHNWRGIGGAEVGDPALWQDARDRIHAAAASLPTGLPDLLGGELRHTLDVAALAADRAVERRAPGGIGATPRKALTERTRAIIDEHRRLWLPRSRPGGLDRSCLHYQAILRDLEP